MTSRPNNRQLFFICGVPAMILLVCAALYFFIGIGALLLPPVLIGIFLGWLIVEHRHYSLGLFIRQTNETRAVFSQMEALLSIYRTLDPAQPFPPTRGWSASPDMLREIMARVLSGKPDLVVEASSGTSTLVIAHCLRKLGKGRVIALEHDELYAGRTRHALREHGLMDFAEVVHAPLVKQNVNGSTMPWYDLSRVTFPGPIEMLVIDGPPETGSTNARYPALPLLYDKLAPGAKVLLDDGAREEETGMVKRWQRELSIGSVEYVPLEKGAWALTI